jgi:serine/threonine protein kinase
MHVMLTGTSPFEDESAASICDGLLEFCPEFNTYDITELATDLVGWMLAVEPSQRPTAREILEHAWFQRCFPDRDKTPTVRGLSAEMAQFHEQLSAPDSAPIEDPLLTGVPT